MWMFIFGPKLGINQILEKWGVEEPPLWLMSTKGFIPLPMWIMAFVALWQYVGQSMMLYMAQISGISKSLMEASYIDGCTKPMAFRYITLPLIKPMVPNELIECACMEGANIFQIFFKICLPLSKTGLFVTGLMTFVGNWNELLMAMVFISDDAKKILPVSLSKFVGPYNTNYSQMFAAIIIAIIPTIIVYCAFSNKIVDGLTAGAVKG